MNYNKPEDKYFAHSANFDVFYKNVLQKVQKDWNHKIGNDILGISKDKVYRIFAGKQKDFETLISMAELMQISFEFKAEQ